LIEMLESPAFRALSLTGHRILARLEIELGHHGGADNGRLPVTYADFERYGIERKSIAPALREVQALGFAKITERGRPSKSDFGRRPNYFELTYLHGSHGEEPTHEWKSSQTLEEAIEVAQQARQDKDTRAVEKSKSRALKKSCAQVGKIRRTGPESHPVAHVLQARNPHLLGRVRKTGQLSIFRERMRQHDRERPVASSLPQRFVGGARGRR
jgi:hypothetical protein